MMLFVISIISLGLLLWFRTDVWLEYCRLFHLNFLSFYKDYDEKYKKDVSLTYHLYLRRYHNCFFIRLITCPICIGVWMALIMAGIHILASILIGIILGTELLTIGVGIIAIMANIPCIILASIGIFTLIDKLLG